MTDLCRWSGVVVSRTHLVGVVIMLGFVPAKLTAQSCTDPNVRDLCHATCDPECSSPSFVRDHVQYCYDAAHRERPIDALDCPFSVSIEAELRNCAAADDVFDCVVRLQNQGTPACSERPVDLIIQSARLSEEIVTELGSYGELLTRDWTAVESRSALCNFDRQLLGESYSRAAGEQTRLSSFLMEATNLRSCRDDWIGWEERAQQQRIREASAAGENTASLDRLLRELQETFAPLNANLQQVETALIRLERAAPDIVTTIGYYSRWCEN